MNKNTMYCGYLGSIFWINLLAVSLVI